MGLKIKKGMGGSNNGKNRHEKTEILKKDSKKIRRRQGKAEVNEQLKNKENGNGTHPADTHR